MRILLADPQPKVLYALRVLLERQPGIEVAGQATDAEAVLRQAQVAHPDILLLGWEMPGREERNLIAALRECCEKIAIIALSGRAGVRQAALTAGADAFVSKGDPPEQLLNAISSCCRE